MALAFALAMRMLICGSKTLGDTCGGTDGRDGPTDAAGGVITSEQGFDQAAASVALAGHASYDYLRSHDQLLMIGATGTNLADLVLVIAQSS